MNQDLTLFLAIEQLVQDKMITHLGMRVARDVDLAELFDRDVLELQGVVKQNTDRFPYDFMVRLSDEDYAFSETGIIMLGGLLSSEKAIKAQIQLIDYFVSLAHQYGISIFDISEMSYPH